MVVAVTDAIPVNQRKRAVEKAVKAAFKRHLPEGISYQLHHHQSRSDLNLQIAAEATTCWFRVSVARHPRVMTGLRLGISREVHVLDRIEYLQGQSRCQPGSAASWKLARDHQAHGSVHGQHDSQGISV